MRSNGLTLLVGILLSGCAHKVILQPVGPIVQVALDDGHASERPLTPSKTFELLMRFDPALPLYQLRRMWLSLAQPGRMTVSIYNSTKDGEPGEAIFSMDRTYDPSLISTGQDGKWVIETFDLPPQHAALWVGLSSPGGGNDPRLWASSNDSVAVFMRDPDPSTPLSATKVPRTPLLRLEFSPTIEDPFAAKGKHKKR